RQLVKRPLIRLSEITSNRTELRDCHLEARMTLVYFPGRCIRRGRRSNLTSGVKPRGEAGGWARGGGGGGGGAEDGLGRMTFATSAERGGTPILILTTRGKALHRS